jgi:hypothetical protein
MCLKSHLLLHFIDHIEPNTTSIPDGLYYVCVSWVSHSYVPTVAEMIVLMYLPRFP